MVMPYQMLKEAVFGRTPVFSAPEHSPITEDQIQMATIDLRLGMEIHALGEAILPQPGEDIEALIARRSHYSFRLSEGKTHHLDFEKTYIVSLVEQCNFPRQVYGKCSPKSSTGRCDVFVRVIAPGYPHYDRIPSGYVGPLYLEITPLSFNVGVCAGLSLTQCRLKTDRSLTLDDDDLVRMHMHHGIVFDGNGVPIDHDQLHIAEKQFYFHVDLDRDVVGFVARKTVMERLDLSLKKETYSPEDFWEPMFRPKNGELVLPRNTFCLLATKERVRIPAECCGEMLSSVTTTGEFRVHYAGFFDNGFGGDTGTNGVLEVRVRDIPFRLIDGQPVCAMVFERTFELPERLYGEGGSNYTRPDPSLSKHFLNRYEAWEADYWRAVR